MQDAPTYTSLTRHPATGELFTSPREMPCSPLRDHLQASLEVSLQNLCAPLEMSQAPRLTLDSRQVRVLEAAPGPGAPPFQVSPPGRRRVWTCQWQKNSKRSRTRRRCVVPITRFLTWWFGNIFFAWNPRGIVEIISSNFKGVVRHFWLSCSDLLKEISVCDLCSCSQGFQNILL